MRGKKLIASLLSVILLLSAFPLTTFAEELPQEQQQQEQQMAQVPQVPQIHIETENGNGTALEKADGYVQAKISITDPDGSVLEDNVSFKVRGNTTALYWVKKKAYTFKFAKKKELYGMGKGKKWVLLANAFDPTLMRNYLAFDTARELGFAYVPGQKITELWIDGAFRGCYTLMTPVQEGKDRVDINIENGKDFMVELESMTEDYGAMQVYYQDQQEALVLLSNEKEKEILAFQAQIDEQQTELTKLQLQMQQDANEIARLEAEAQAKALEARLKQLQDQTGVVIPASISRDPIITPITPYNGEIFVWPQPSSTRITSDYGWRGDIGIPGASKDHKGIDIAANMYDPVVAAASGTVIFVGYDGSGGNTVKIDIGQDLVIIYHHLSRYAVVKGDTVNAGQVVGYAGSTGVSSAPHLHFSVKLNGQYVNPRPYLGLPY